LFVATFQILEELFFPQKPGGSGSSSNRRKRGGRGGMASYVGGCMLVPMPLLLPRELSSPTNPRQQFDQATPLQHLYVISTAVTHHTSTTVLHDALLFEKLKFLELIKDVSFAVGMNGTTLP
jgi:hypothetical protein